MQNAIKQHEFSKLKGIREWPNDASVPQSLYNCQMWSCVFSFSAVAWWTPGNLHVGPLFNFVIFWPTQILMHCVWGIVIEGVCYPQPYCHMLLKMQNIYLCDHILLLDCVWGNFIKTQGDSTCTTVSWWSQEILQVCYIVNINGKEGRNHTY